MLLLTLLHNEALKPERGDVVVFNNTSAEHPRTYAFVRDCARVARSHGVPFFWVEYQTYEDARSGEWTRVDSYRLVNDHPKSKDNPNGFHWRGEVFEELLSWSGYLPNLFSRTCTKAMKLEVTRLFLTDWLAAKPNLSRLGHYGDEPRICIEDLHTAHRRNRGSVPLQIFTEKREFALKRPHVRPEQSYADYCPAWRLFDNRTISDKVFGNRATFGKNGAEYVALVGLRDDEGLRVERVLQRNDGPGASGHTGEHVYMPLSDMDVTKEDVTAFWNEQEWDLELPSDGALSNCVYCFLKGKKNLESVFAYMKSDNGLVDAELGSLRDTPSDYRWWEEIEKKYGRDLKAEKRKIRNKEVTHLGFGGNGGLLFKRIELGATGNPQTNQFVNAPLPCDCTD